MRQAQESAIIRLSMHIREGKDFRTFPTVSGEVGIVPHKFMFEGEDIALLQADQIICGTNAERNRLNQRIRELQGRGPEPEIGDKIIGLDNHWSIVSTEGNALTNGTIGTIQTYTRELQTYSTGNRMVGKLPPTELMFTDFTTEDGDSFTSIPIDYQCIITGEPSLTPKQEALLANYCKRLAMGGLSRAYKKYVPFHFNYGYAITCWKAQGSEFPLVLGYEAAWLKRQNPEEYKKYLYTLCTRAQNTILLVGD